MGRATKPLMPCQASSLNLMAVGTLEKKGSKKSYFYLNGPALYARPLLMARPLREVLFLRLP